MRSSKVSGSIYQRKLWNSHSCAEICFLAQLKISASQNHIRCGAIDGEMRMDTSRRTFLKQGAVFSAACLASFEGQAGAAALRSDALETTEAQKPGWYDRPMRWAQLSFVENDPGNYDLAFWLDYFKRLHVDAAWEKALEGAIILLAVATDAIGRRT